MTAAARSTSSRPTSRWVTARNRRGPNGTSSTPAWASLGSTASTVSRSRTRSIITMFDLERERDTVDAVLPKLAQAGVLLVPFGPRRLRAVTHLDVGRDEVERAAAVIRRVVG